MGSHEPKPFENIVGRDLYLDPWWALKEALTEDAKILTDRLTELLGEPDLWFNGDFHELLWGPRPIHRAWRPVLHANRTDITGKLWVKLWLPWRAGQHPVPMGERRPLYKGLPYAANILQEQVELGADLEAAERYALIAPYIERIYLE